MNDREGYTNLKISLFSVLDAARDLGLHVESAQYRIGNGAKKINRYIGKKANWYYQHKYANKNVANCEMDKKTIEGDLVKLTKVYEKFYKVDLNNLSKTVSVSLKH
jgi:hypothetical protein